MAAAVQTIITPEMRKLYEEQAAQWPVMRRAVSPNPSWHLAQVLSGSERSVCDRLKASGFGMYYPKTVQFRPRSRERMSRKQREAANNGFAVLEPKIRALLPGYLFVHFDLENDAWRMLFDLAGVRGLWLNGNVPKRVPDQLIDSFTSKEVDGLIPGSTPVAELFKIGDEVLIGAGPFAGYTGTIGTLPPGYPAGDTPIEQLDESMTFQVLVSIFGRDTPVSMALGQFEHA